MDNKLKRSWAEISLRNIEHNYKSIRSQLPEGCRFMGVVKANAYGHGAVAVSTLLEKLGCEYLAVACFDEAVELRDAGISLPILILGYTPTYLTSELVRLNITQAISSIEMAREMSHLLDDGQTLKIHIKLDSGMSRTGFSCDIENTVDEIVETLSLPGLDAEGIFSHFAASDEYDNPFNKIQFQKFIKTVATVENASRHSFTLKHCANSGAVINYPETCLDMVRPGITLYGLYPGPEKSNLDLRPAMSLKTKIAAIYSRKSGDTVSYGRTYTVESDSKIAVIPIGYADGLHRFMSSKVNFLLNGELVPQVGRICMDMCMIDVTNHPNCKIGDVVTIFGTHEGYQNPVEEIAEKCGTINYEIVCSPSRRIPRIYID